MVFSGEVRICRGGVRICRGVVRICEPKVANKKSHFRLFVWPSCNLVKKLAHAYALGDQNSTESKINALEVMYNCF